MKRSLLIVLVGASLLAAWFAAAGWCIVAPGEVVVVRRFGRVIDPPWRPGLHWHYPLAIDRLDRIRTDVVRRLTIGGVGPASVDREPSVGEMLTGDLNLVRVEATLQYRVAQPIDYALASDQPEELIARSAEAGLLRALARRGVDAALRSDRRRIAQEVADDLQTVADRLRLGVLILGVSLTDARPPTEVAADFAEAQAAESRREDRVNVARTYDAVQLATAASRGEALREAARAAAGRNLLTARAEVDRFLALLTEVRRSRDLTLRHLYIETVQSLLERVRRTVILPPGDSIDLTVLGLSGPSANPPAAQPVQPDAQQPPQSKDNR
jgi:modulator of FtsH protease HflK